MRRMMAAALAAAAMLGLAGAALAQGQATAAKSRGYIGQMTEEQIRQKLEGEGYSKVMEIKKIPITSYQWTAKAERNGKPMEITINERGHVSAK